jgi:hypothetical protein
MLRGVVHPLEPTALLALTVTWYVRPRVTVVQLWFSTLADTLLCRQTL